MRKGCYNCARAEWDSEGATCGINGMHVGRPSLGCNNQIPEKRMTNGDRIRRMTDEEFVKSIGLACKRCAYYKVGHGECSGQDKEYADGNLEWLKQEVSEDAGAD